MHYKEYKELGTVQVNSPRKEGYDMIKETRDSLIENIDKVDAGYFDDQVTEGKTRETVKRILIDYALGNMTIALECLHSLIVGTNRPKLYMHSNMKGFTK